MTMSIDTKMKEDSPSANQDGGANAPSGFILKLFQMVNGAPDEVISVSKEQFFCENENIGWLVHWSANGRFVNSFHRFR